MSKNKNPEGDQEPGKPAAKPTVADVHQQLRAELAKGVASGDASETGPENKTNPGAGEQDQSGGEDVPAKDPKAQIRRLMEEASQPGVLSDDQTALEDEAMEEGDSDLGDASPVPKSYGYSLERMNRLWSLVLIGSKAVMVREQPDGKIEDRVRVVQVESFRHLYSNKPTQVMSADGKIKTISWAKRWEGERDRRQYDGIDFFPNPDGAKSHAGYLNLWRGFSVKPDSKKGSYTVFRDHMLTNICNGDQVLFDWVFAWFAQMMQRPRERTGTAIVVRGLMGTGKSIMGEIMGDLVAAHYFQVDDPRYITGQFNAHMSACLLLQAEEAVWAGDKVAEGRLKGLITSKTQMIESKGVDPYRLDNFVRVLMTSNEDWVVPAGKDERRYCVLDCAPNAKENHGYFQEMFDELDNGGREALLADLLAIDLSRVNLRKVPRTRALLEQKLRTLDSMDSFIFQRLHEGTLLRADEVWQPGGCVVKQVLYDEYWSSSDKVGIKRRGELEQFTKKIKKLIPGLDDRRPRGASRKRAYVFPPLKECRASFEAAVGQAVDWPEDDEDDDYEV